MASHEYFLVYSDIHSVLCCMELWSTLSFVYGLRNIRALENIWFHLWNNIKFAILKYFLWVRYFKSCSKHIGNRKMYLLLKVCHWYRENILFISCRFVLTIILRWVLNLKVAQCKLFACWRWRKFMSKFKEKFLLNKFMLFRMFFLKDIWTLMEMVKVMRVTTCSKVI